MTTTTFLMAWGVALTVHATAFFVVGRLMLQPLLSSLGAHIPDESERRRLRWLNPIAIALYSLVFAFFAFQYAEAKGEMSLLHGLLYGWLVGILSFASPAILVSAWLREIAASLWRMAGLGILANLVAGGILSLLLV